MKANQVLKKKSGLPRFTEDLPDTVTLVRRKTTIFDCLKSSPSVSWDIREEFIDCGVHRYSLMVEELEEYYEEQ